MLEIKLVMLAHGAFSPEMITVYLAAISTIGVLFKIISDLIEKREARKDALMRRRWEVEDRAYKADQSKRVDEAKAAAVASAKIASKTAHTLTEKIEGSKSERKEQLEKVTQLLQDNTTLTQESKDASKEAIEVANGHNAKILKATELAERAVLAAERKGAD